MGFKQIFIINSDLKMGAGKIGVQTAHAATYYMEAAHGLLKNKKLHDQYLKWRYDNNGCMKKIVKRATEAEMVNITERMAHLGIWACQVFDAGLTQVAPNSFTCLVIEPLSDELCDELFGHLKLL